MLTFDIPQDRFSPAALVLLTLLKKSIDTLLANLLVEPNPPRISFNLLWPDTQVKDTACEFAAECYSPKLENKTAKGVLMMILMSSSQD